MAWTTGLRRLAVAAVCVATAACGGGDDGGDATADAAADGPTVTIAGFAFGAVPEVAAGETLTIANDDGAAHTFTAGDGTFDTGSIPGGDATTLAVDAPGEYAFACSIHPSMTGTLVVTG